MTMTRKKTIAAFVALAATVTLAPAGAAFAFGGSSPGGLGGSVLSGLPIGESVGDPLGDIDVHTASVGQASASTFSANPDNLSAASYDGELPIAGRVAARSTLPQGAILVQLRVNGRIISMALDTGGATAELGANPADDDNKALYTSIQHKQMVVIGDAEVRNQITAAADSSKPLVLQGYVFDRTSPYFVVRSASTID
jgi:hypothetical protein